MQKTVIELVSKTGLPLIARKALVAAIEAVVKAFGYNKVCEGTSCEPGVLNAEFKHVPEEGVQEEVDPQIAIDAKAKKAKAAPAKAKAKPKAKAKAKAVAKKGAKTKK